MGGLLSYSGLATKIRAMESRLLEIPQFEEISRMTSVPQVVDYLKHHPGYEKLWARLDDKEINRFSVEKLLIQSIYQNFTKIYRFADNEQKKFLAIYFKRYEMAVMKRCLASIFDHREVALDLSWFEVFFRKHSRLDLNRLTSCKTIEEFIESLKGTEFYTPLNQLRRGDREGLMVFDYGMALDQYYFAEIWRQRKRVFTSIDLREITKSYGRKFDLINLTWIYRSKKYYHMDSSKIFTLLIPMHYKLKTSEISALVQAEDMKEFQSLLEQTYYGRKFEELTPENLEDSYTYVMRGLLKREAYKHPHSVAVIYSYLYQKEHEVKRLTTAIECVRYGVPPEDTMRHILKN